MAINTIITWTRKGTCDRRKCRAACCRALNIESGEFENDRGTIPSELTVHFTNSTCSNINELGRTFDCKIYKNRPSVCEEFPSSPWDMIYRKVKSRCSYWFEIEIKEVEDNTSPSPTDSPSPNLSPSPTPDVGDIRFERNGGT